MKYGEHLKANIAPEYGPEPYLCYERLDDIIRELSATAPSSVDLANRQVSLTTPPQTNAQGLAQSSSSVTEEAFLKLLDTEMAKVEAFTLKKVTELRAKLAAAEKQSQKSSNNNNNTNNNTTTTTSDATFLALQQMTDEIAEHFLQLEKYVNINFMGFHKILKKHDKWLPNNPCKTFYVNRMHAQAWVRGDYSDVVVRMSQIYAALRQDQAVPETDDAAQSFLRSTTKYWVKTEDVSRVKYAMLRHLPVFLQKTSTGESDSQFTNSVYIDNDQLELYHGRLDKTPGAIALRLRWYGVGDPKLVFVERKTHNEKWTGEVSVKERFMIDESEVQQVLTNTYPIATKKQEMIDAGKSDKEIEEWETLVREVTQVIASKQLVPTMRTQCMRTAFQIPFDATVRISLDTNLCMISERGYDLQDMKVWHRDPSWVLAPNEIHRFPHAVLEIKLELKGGDTTPPKWVTDLQNSGLLYECHKYSKYVHGCAVLLPDDVRCVPYWVDDASLRDSIISCGGHRILVDAHVGSGPGATSVYSHLLPFGNSKDNRRDTAVGRTSSSTAASTGFFTSKKKTTTAAATTTTVSGGGDSGGSSHRQAAARAAGINFGDDEYHDHLEDEQEEEDEQAANMMDDCVGWAFPFCSPRNHHHHHHRGIAFYDPIVAPTSIQKIEPKVFLANERTYLHWLHHGVILATIASGVLAFSADKEETWGEWYALLLLPISLGFCMYALHVFLWRADRIKTRIPGRWDDPFGPLVLGSAVVLVLFINFCAKLYEIAKYESERKY